MGGEPRREGVHQGGNRKTLEREGGREERVYGGMLVVSLGDGMERLPFQVLER